MQAVERSLSSAGGGAFGGTGVHDTKTAAAVVQTVTLSSQLPTPLEGRDNTLCEYLFPNPTPSWRAAEVDCTLRHYCVTARKVVVVIH